MGIPDLINVLPWKCDGFAIPVQSLSSGGFVLVPSGTFPYGASAKVIILSTIL